MRPLLLLLLAAATSSLQAADPAEKSPAAEKAPDGADAAWAAMTQKFSNPGKLDSREAITAFQKSLLTSLSEFIEKYPQSPHATEARFARVQMQLSLLLSDSPEKPDLSPIEKELRDLAVQANTPAQLKSIARVMLLQMKIKYGTAEETERELSTFEKDFPDFPIPPMIATSLAQKLQTVNPDRAEKLRGQAEAFEKQQAEKKARAEVEANKRLNQPLELKFTAVDGSNVDLQKMRGKVVLVDFWATWCGPCMAELPSVLAAYKKYHDQGFEIVGISFDQDKEALLNVTKKEGMTWPQYFDGEGWGNKFGKEFGINSIPRMWLVNKEGLLVDLNARQDLEAKVAKLLEK